ncbi:MAG: hypothetical protein ACTSP4_02905 [Candidatus Hodarchaeales archaeon]
MAAILDPLYERLWDNEKNRTFILSTTILMLLIFIELFFIMFPETDIRKIFGILYLPFTMQGVEVTPLIDLVHLLLWAVIFFCFLISYSYVKLAVTNKRAGLIDIAVSGAIFTAIVLLIMSKYTVELPFYSLILTSLYVGILFLVFGYLWFSLKE